LQIAIAFFEIARGEYVQAFNTYTKRAIGHLVIIMRRQIALE